MAIDFNNNVTRELNYYFKALQHQVTELLPQSLPEQNDIFHQVLRKIEPENGALLFLDAPGGTGKTFLLNPFGADLILICDADQVTGFVTFLENDVTTHYRFEIRRLPYTAPCAQRFISPRRRGRGLVLFHGGAYLPPNGLIYYLSVRKDQKIALAKASPGITAMLLTGGRTIHSILK
ncbi:hypothetical protein EVAR_101403_1 [Eumeta japonica]|uniref:ATP-dependent DNA helicase n=1 Tax=Eumeta variegata TaxID=151549 RepID=A0A4C1T9I2_EUMVA|nr:hypothetical protein EVAR_101403_1 [Eumeta japonica]